MQPLHQLSSAAQSGPDGLCGLLDKLKDAHSELLAAIADMESATRADRPETGRYTAARWQISQASLKRRRLSLIIRNALIPIAGDPDKAVLKSLQQLDQQNAIRSHAHVNDWPPAKIVRDWAGYCQASRTIRWYMESHVAMEQKLLCPLLERIERRARAG